MNECQDTSVFAAEFTHIKLKVRLTDVDDAKVAVFMHIENAERRDITAMERALSFQQQLEAKIFPTQDAMAEAFGLGSPQVTKMLKAAQLFKHAPIARSST
jgi:ParB family chromosome partitioning protein